MHPLDTLDRREMVKDEFKIGYCNITKCCTEVCPENIHITDNGIIPLKERVADDYFDPIRWIVDKVAGGEKKEKARLPVVQNDGSMTVRATPASKRGE
jgi:succinate dehydrogenase / fumarate reductase iron-sulfur subunit